MQSMKNILKVFGTLIIILVPSGVALAQTSFDYYDPYLGVTLPVGTPQQSINNSLQAIDDSEMYNEMLGPDSLPYQKLQNMQQQSEQQQLLNAINSQTQAQQQQAQELQKQNQLLQQQIQEQQQYQSQQQQVQVPQCAAGTVLYDDSCMTYDEECRSNFGSYSVWNGAINSSGGPTCDCASGYAWNSAATACVAQQAAPTPTLQQCNGKSWNACPAGQTFSCPAIGDPMCESNQTASGSAGGGGGSDGSGVTTTASAPMTEALQQALIQQIQVLQAQLKSILAQIAAGTAVAVGIDPSSPSYAVQAGGTTGVTVGVIKLRASNESFNLTKLGLTLTNSATGKTGSGIASNAAADLTTVYLYNGATLLGTATFTGSSNNATSTLSQPFLITRDVDTQITIKADLANIGVSSPGGVGDTVKVDPANFEGTGVSSGTTIKGPTATNSVTPGVAGVRLFKTTPTLALDTLPTTGVADGRLIHFKVTASSAGPVGIALFNFTSSWSVGGPVTNVSLYGFTDSSYSQPISGQSAGGLINSSVVNPSTGVAFSLTSSTTPVQIPAGQTYYFELRGSVAGVVSGTSVVTTLNGDGNLPAVTGGYQVSNVAGLLAGSKFIWSGNSTTTVGTTGVDWSNGYSIPGLPSSGLIQTRSN